mmetsp:Transcript_18152/g.55620  ORF Transcript_18152/g.55620 Transcript_18152/m.55620 type:complete len:229 (-) Transcript_18152:408-1094(-)
MPRPKGAAMSAMSIFWPERNSRLSECDRSAACMPSIESDVCTAEPFANVVDDAPPGGSRTTANTNDGSVVIVYVCGTSSGMVPMTTASLAKTISDASEARRNSSSSGCVKGAKGFGSPTSMVNSKPTQKRGSPLVEVVESSTHSETSYANASTSKSLPLRPSSTLIRRSSAAFFDANEVCGTATSLSKRPTKFSASKLSDVRGSQSGVGAKYSHGHAQSRFSERLIFG